MFTVVTSLAVADGKPHTAITGSATIQVELHDILFAIASTPDDQVYDCDVRRCSDKGVGGNDATASVGNTDLVANVEPSYSAGGVAGTVTKGTWGTADPTKSAIVLLPCVFNQRATFRFPILPGHPLRGLFAADDGLVVFCNDGAGGTVKVNPWYRINT